MPSPISFPLSWRLALIPLFSEDTRSLAAVASHTQPVWNCAVVLGDFEWKPRHGRRKRHAMVKKQQTLINGPRKHRNLVWMSFWVTSLGDKTKPGKKCPLFSDFSGSDAVQPKYFIAHMQSLSECKTWFEHDSVRYAVWFLDMKWTDFAGVWRFFT